VCHDSCIMRESIGLEPLFPDRESAEPLGRQFVRRLRHAIENGVFKPSSRLLPSRELALRLGLSRNTVTTAIEQLIAEGYLESRVGSGTFVAPTIAKHQVVEMAAAHSLPLTAQRFLSVVPALERYQTRGGPLRVGVPDPTTFPHATWARITRRKIADLSAFLDYSPGVGNRLLREAIVQHVQQFRGITTEPDCVVVVEGTQGALRLAADVLLADGDPVLIEDPSYPMAQAVFRTRNMRVVPVDVDLDGLQIARAPAARLAYVTPSHQFPLGAVLSVERRRLLLEWAACHDAYVLEDDYDSEFAFDGKPLPALQSLDRDGRVIYIGSFSKTLAPGLRLGYLIVPPHLAEAFAVARVLATIGGTKYVQATLADFVAEGHFVRHVRRVTRLYSERRRALVAVLDEGLPKDRYALRVGNIGLHVAVVAGPDFDDVGICKALRERDVCVEPLTIYCARRTDCRGFVVGYSAAPAADIVEAAQALVRGLSIVAN
jgi:GntR family transcriptional regulator/MocR family aminotransferase